MTDVTQLVSHAQKASAQTMLSSMAHDNMVFPCAGTNAYFANSVNTVLVWHFVNYMVVYGT